MVLNPVRAKAVKRPEQWRWSSYQATAGIGKPHPCLSAEWILNQFGSTRRIAEKAYRKFVEDGIKQESIWEAVRAQSILGEEEFTATLTDYLRGKKDIAELPKSQRYIDRPSLENIFSKDILKDISKRNRKISEVVRRHGYRQREIADYLEMHFTSISRILRERGKC